VTGAMSVDDLPPHMRERAREQLLIPKTPAVGKSDVSNMREIERIMARAEQGINTEPLRGDVKPRGRNGGRRAQPEHEHQRQLFSWADDAITRLALPDVEWLYAIPNGGHRHKATAGKMKAEGVRAGYPDIGLDVARSGFNGFRGELKAPGAPGANENQRRWHAWLKRQGYCVVVCHGWEAMRDEIIGYLTMDKER